MVDSLSLLQSSRSVSTPATPNDLKVEKGM